MFNSLIVKESELEHIEIVKRITEELEIRGIKVYARFWYNKQRGQTNDDCQPFFAYHLE
jgi:hypothetical protein